MAADSRRRRAASVLAARGQPIPQPPTATQARPESGCCGPALDPHPADHQPPAVPLASASAPTPAAAPVASVPAAAVFDRMVLLPGGPFLMGSDSSRSFPADGEGPVREVTLDPFWIDRCPVTNRLFAAFVRHTGYVTEAERFGWSFVFWSQLPPDRIAALVEDTVAAAPWWCKVRGATWRAPAGPGSHVRSRPDHPVVHVSWNDTQAFCAWSGQRLPTEAEWEYAARGGLVQQLYPWGDELTPGARHQCNIWQGDFPRCDTAEDGFRGTCPVRAFPPNAFGLYSLAGNAWDWCADWFSPTHHRTASRYNPQGPSSGVMKVMKGGSFLCHESYCNRYRLAARTGNTPDSTSSHLGFRCARSAS